MSESRVSTARRFHEATKYSPRTVGSHPGLDWSKQPVPFKNFLSEDRVELASKLLVARDEATERLMVLPHQDGPIDLPRLSTILLHTFGVTAVMHDNLGNQQLFRAAPSAGALYPTEIYVVCREIEGVPDGIHNYQVRDHSLAPVLEGDFAADLRSIAFGHPAVTASNCVLLFGAIWYRSAWRYMDRAYRRILLDTGHAIGNLALIAPRFGLRAPMVADFDDEALTSLLLLDDRQESILTLVPLVAAEVRTPRPPLRRSSDAEVFAESLIVALHRAGRLNGSEERAQSPDEPDPQPDLPLLPLPPGRVELGEKLAETILDRRSTREFTGGPILFEELAALLRFTADPLQQESGPGSREEFIAPRRLSTWIAALNVTGLEAGLYAVDPDLQGLRLVRAGRFAADCHRITLGQELGRSAAAIVFHTTRLDRLVRDFGDRGYRYLGLDAGHLGERLNLAALRAGLGISGIGGYFDDEINELFGFAPEEAVVYVTCIGQPPQEF